jgi:hypothetical protein
MSISEILVVERELATSVIMPQCASLTVSGHLQPRSLSILIIGRYSRNSSAFHPYRTLQVPAAAAPSGSLLCGSPRSPSQTG